VLIREDWLICNYWKEMFAHKLWLFKVLSCPIKVVYTKRTAFYAVNFSWGISNHECALHCQTSFSHTEILSQLLTILFTIRESRRCFLLRCTYFGKVRGSGQRFSKSSPDSPEELDNSLVLVLTGVSRAALLLRRWSCTCYPRGFPDQLRLLSLLYSRNFSQQCCLHFISHVSASYVI